MGKKTEKSGARRCGSSGRRRKRKETCGQELWVVKTEHRAPRRCSSGLWRKKITALRKSEEETNRKKQEAEAEKQEAEVKADIKANIRAAAAWEDGFDTGQYKGWWGRGGNNCPLVVTLYAKLGLHRYNMLQGTNFQFHCIEKYSRSRMLMPASYYITLVAEDLATPFSRIPFQTHVCEGGVNQMDVVCYIARLKETGTAVRDPSDTLSFFNENSDVPKWPSEKAFADKARSFYEESEWVENDWIRLYLELAFVTTNRRFFSDINDILWDLKILKVLLETDENPNERLKCFGNAVVYITYDESLGENRFCKRRAIVKRVVNPISKSFFLVGKILKKLPHDSDI